MIKTTPKIGWVRWQNPYAMDNTEDEDEEDNWDNDEEEFDKFDENIQHIHPINKNMKMVLTPMGAIPLPEHSAPQKVFNLWVAHTNFNITKPILDIVEKTDGVETVDIFTRYRMRVGIGKMFDTKDTIRRINNNLISALNPNPESGLYDKEKFFTKK
jgi:hypothetical protein